MTADMKEAIQNIADAIREIDGDETKMSITEMPARIARLSSVPTGDYVTRDELNGYQPVGEYIDRAELDQLRTDFGREISDALGSYATKDEVESIRTQGVSPEYVTTEIESAISGIRSEMLGEMNNYAFRSEISELDNRKIDKTQHESDLTMIREEINSAVTGSQTSLDTRIIDLEQRLSQIEEAFDGDY